jgi:hypothetical protein
MGTLTRAPRRGQSRHETDAQPTILVWIDSREARVARHLGEVIELQRIESDVPPHTGATGHVRHDGTRRHGAASDPQNAAERQRLAHLEAFLGQVAERLDPEADLIVIGPGTVHERLGRRLVTEDRRHGRERQVRVEAAERLTDRQLAARLRTLEVVEG